MNQKRLSKLNRAMSEEFIHSLINEIRNLQSNADVNKESKNQGNNPLTLLAGTLLDTMNHQKSNNEKNSDIKNHNDNSSNIDNSGNSDIDIKIHIDLSSIALAMLYSLFASKQLSNEELETALKRLEGLKEVLEKNQST